MPLEPLFAALEQNITDSLNVERLAETGHLSRSQLYREFYSVTGHSVKEYVRKRRLSKALAMIKHTDMPLRKIAKECGFSSEQALCKSVKAVLNQTPKEYRASGDEYYFPACEDQQDHVVTITTETIPPTLCLRYYDSCLKGIENRALAWLFAARPDYNSRIFGRRGAQQGSKLCYELHIEAESADQPAVSSTFAKISCPDIEDEINAAWDYLYNNWLKTSMFTQAEQPWFEEYIHANGHVKRLQLYLPVQKRQGFHKIQLCQCDEMQFLIAHSYGKNAEKSASKKAMDFLAANHPRLAQSARQFYVSTAQDQRPGLRLVRGDGCACGVALQSPLKLPPDCGVEIITQLAGEYAMLEGDCCGDSGAYEAVLAAWIGSMGLTPATAPFSVYEADSSFDKQNIRVKIYWKIEK